jgi:hypothetical protein
LTGRVQRVSQEGVFQTLVDVISRKRGIKQIGSIPGRTVWEKLFWSSISKINRRLSIQSSMVKKWNNDARDKYVQ